jgi:hypothetical protein
LKPLSPLTCKIVAYLEVPQFSYDDCIDWAIEMLELGHETPSLLILAGLSKPTDYFESANYLKRALEELDIQTKSGEQARLSYGSFYIQNIAEGQRVRANLQGLCNFVISANYEKILFDFYLLHWAWNDLDYNDGVQFYWPDADQKNIESIVVKTAQKWIQTYKTLTP